MIAKISDSLIPTLPPAIQKPYEVCDTDISGFRLMVRPSGVKSFIYKYTSPITGNRYTATLGKYGTITATSAREKAKLEAAKVTLGKDIQLDEKEKRKNNKIKQLQTLGVFFHDHYANNLSMKKNGHKIIKHLEVTFVNQWKEKQLSTINRELIDKWRSKRIKQGVKPSTINRDIAPLRSLLNEAFKIGLIEKHPLADYSKLTEDSEGIVRYFVDDEKERFLKALEDRQNQDRLARSKHNVWLIKRRKPALPEFVTKFTDHLMPIALLTMNTGMRRSEVLLLRWEHINFDKKLLTVKSINAKNEKHRHIPLNPIALETLQEWIKNTTSLDFVFTNPKTNEPFKNIDSSWKNLMKEAKIDNFRFHDLRHNFASQLVMKGIDLYTVKELLGHSSIEVTQKYAHLSPDHKAAAVELLIN